MPSESSSVKRRLEMRFYSGDTVRQANAALVSRQRIVSDEVWGKSVFLLQVSVIVRPHIFRLLCSCQMCGGATIMWRTHPIKSCFFSLL